jgi:hypothetical protein
LERSQERERGMRERQARVGVKGSESCDVMPLHVWDMERHERRGAGVHGGCSSARRGGGLLWEERRASVMRGEKGVSTPQPPHNCQCQYLVVFADKGGGWSSAVDARDLLTRNTSVSAIYSHAALASVQSTRAIYSRKH